MVHIKESICSELHNNIHSHQNMNIGDAYDRKVVHNPLSQTFRESSQMFWVKAFNNWIKAVVINKYCAIRNNEVRKALDMPPSSTQRNLLHVLDVGCGHGQDISKWGQNNVGYIVGIDVSEKALDQYLKRWRSSNIQNLYQFLQIKMSGSSPELFKEISHSYYDIISAQLSLHYMFGSQASVRTMLGNILQNLLDGGYMVLTIPDSCSIVKKMRTFAKKQGDYWVHGNQYYSIRFKSLDFNKEDGCFGLEYGFYLRQAIGSQNSQTKQKQYWNEYLIELGAFERILNQYGMEVIESKNFLQFYKENMVQYKDLFSKMRLVFNKNESISQEFWQVAHLYRVFVARKTGGRSEAKSHRYTYSNRMEDRKKVTQKRQSINRGYHQNNYSGYRDKRGGGGPGGHNRSKSGSFGSYSQNKRNYY